MRLVLKNFAKLRGYGASWKKVFSEVLSCFAFRIVLRLYQGSYGQEVRVIRLLVIREMVVVSIQNLLDSLDILPVVIRRFYYSFENYILQVLVINCIALKLNNRIILNQPSTSSSTSLILTAMSLFENGFAIKLTPPSSTPRCAMMSAV